MTETLRDRDPDSGGGPGPQDGAEAVPDEYGALARDLSTAPRDSGDPVLPKLGPLGWARWFWRQLTSMRVALLLLFLLALAAVPGSVLPQRSAGPTEVAEFARRHPDLAPVLDKLQLFDVFGSTWFAAVYLLLFVSLIGCIVPRSMAHLRAMRALPPAAPRNLSRLPASVRLEAEADAESVLAEARRLLRGRRFRLREGVTGESGGWIAAEKGYLRETGNLFFHIALLFILVAFAIGSMFGYRGTALVVEGGGFSNALVMYDTFTPGRSFDLKNLSPFSLTLDDFRATYYERGPQRGQASSFEADVTYRVSPDAPPSAAAIRVNHPLDIDGTKVFLQGHGYAPVFTVRDGQGQIALRGPVPFLPQDPVNLGSTGVVKVADARPQQLAFQGFFLPTGTFDPKLGPVSLFPAPLLPMVALTAFQGDLGLDSGIPQSVYRLETRKLTQLKENGEPLRILLRPGQTATLPDGLGSISFDGYREWSNFSLAHDPGKGIALGAAAVAVLGVMLSLGVHRRRIWVRAAPGGPGGPTVVEVAGLARTEGAVAGLAEEVRRVAGELCRTPAGSDAVASGAEPDPDAESDPTSTPEFVSGPASDVDSGPVPGAEPAAAASRGGDEESR